MSELFAASSHDEFVTSLAALALYDGGAEITSDNIKALLDGSNNTVQPYWPALFASLLKGDRIESLIYSLSATGPAPSEMVIGMAAPRPQVKERREVKEVDPLDGGMDLFGGDNKGDY